MSKEADRVRITCPNCDGFIASAPKDDMPKGDLVCPTCGAIVKALTGADMLVAEVKKTVKDAVGSSDEDGEST